MVSWSWRRRSATKSFPVDEDEQYKFQHIEENISAPEFQSVLLLRAIRQPYEATASYAVPVPQLDSEMLVMVKAVGLNPIDWKAPDYNFGIPTLPYVAGREFVGTIIQVSKTHNSRLKEGDLVIVPSTDYRDLRKAAFQEYSIASTFNAIRVPRQISTASASILGVAFVSAALALGICMGVGFEKIEDGPDLLKVVRNINPESLPVDMRQECLEGIGNYEQAKADDFLVIWGGSSTCAHAMKQIARLAGLRIISVVDGAKHGLRLSTHTTARPDLLVDSHDPERAIDIIKTATNNRARFGFDTIGKETAGHLLRALAPPSSNITSLPKDQRNTDRKDSTLPTPPSTPLVVSLESPRAHLVGLTGLPKGDLPEGLALHSVPIKLFHEVPEVGEALSGWCERLLLKGLFVPPDVVGTVDGLTGINEGLDRMRRREISGGRLVAVLR
ncbi:GroES-like protein [Dothidotthia symphoricarpi CBS 119687]|uniref:GroES-like protein n=1 Tax=Dothidotthia symphoricarpi CBS 119687 TaxID=1392245 RepID=A0A6A6A890_9PLEO|nr:GroES-like protein [Dothidotthia symphoricarpi CBS 119687]KAF2127037.1 GroES-like protein [Dothidotthia symphoricarpi CBS 119687]